MYCSSIGEIGGQEGCFILTSVSTSLFITSLGRPGLKIYVSGATAGSTCGSEKGQPGQTLHKGVCKRRGQETKALGVLFA